MSARLRSVGASAVAAIVAMVPLLYGEALAGLIATLARDLPTPGVGRTVSVLAFPLAAIAVVLILTALRPALDAIPGKLAGRR